MERSANNFKHRSGATAMKRLFLASLVGGMLAFPLTAAEPKKELIEVQAIGLLSFTGVRENNNAEWTHSYYIVAEEKRLLLYCYKNPEALKLLKEKSGSQRSEWSSELLPALTIKVKGRLKFRPEPNPESPAKPGEKPAVVPVIVVETLKIVEGE
jgi:hypothetical protein